MDAENLLLEEYSRIKDLLRANNIHTSVLRKIAHGLQFKIFIGTWFGLLRVYINKKRQITRDYSQIRNRDYQIKLRELIEGNSLLLIIQEYSGNEVEIHYPLIRTDESGKGDYFTP